MAWCRTRWGTDRLSRRGSGRLSAPDPGEKERYLQYQILEYDKEWVSCFFANHKVDVAPFETSASPRPIPVADMMLIGLGLAYAHDMAGSQHLSICKHDRQDMSL